MMLAVLSGCKDYDEWMAEESHPVEAALMLSVSSMSNVTRMSGDIVQANGNFRGLMDLRAIPFATLSKVTAADRPKAYDTEGLRSDEYAKSDSRFYFFETCSFMSGVSSFLVYARANAATDADGLPQDPAANGSLVADLSVRAAPADIRFAPRPIYADSDAPVYGEAIAECLTAVATTAASFGGQTYRWRAASDTRLRAFYQNFTGQGDATNALIPSSTANVQQYLSALRQQIYALTFEANTVGAALRTAILDAIDEQNALLPANYPASVGLPAGAAVVQWNGTRFEPQTTTTTLSAISNIRRYAYPAELYYFANSLIKTSERDSRQPCYASESTWNNILGQYEHDNATITTNTTAVAIKKPLQYAVACLKIGFNNSASALTDAKGNAVSIGASTFPLTGIIVGSQRPVGFDFVPTSDSDFDTRFIYDSNPVTATGQQLCLGGNTTATTNTLVLQTCDGEEVTLILEFLNNSGTAFRGLNGVVYPGTRFYLIGSIEPKASPSSDYEKRAFTQDYTTQIAVTAASLAKAYNVLPDILAPHLEVGVQLTPQWTLVTPTMVSLN